jgi:hypothetical protein
MLSLATLRLLSKIIFFRNNRSEMFLLNISKDQIESVKKERCMDGNWRYFMTQ